IDVVSDGDFIEQGATVEIVEVAGTRVVVRRKS
ncbi:MAG TPA: serine peptidase, partial [Polyangia bacterium]|nr:serine peptidase [Polyangia bacterium]